MVRREAFALGDGCGAQSICVACVCDGVAFGRCLAHEGAVTAAEPRAPVPDLVLAPYGPYVGEVQPVAVFGIWV